MESRPQYLEAEIITAENFKQEGRLGDALASQKVKHQLDVLRYQRRKTIDELDKAIIDLTYNSDENRRKELTDELAEIYRDYQQPADDALTAYEHHVDTVKAQALEEANLALAFINFKKNIIVALQIAAHTAFADADIRSRSKNFNSIFKNVSMLNHDGGIYHHTAALNDYSTLDLNEWQNMLSNLLDDCTKYGELKIRETIISELLSLNDMAYHNTFQCKTFIIIENNSASFSKNLHDLESRGRHFSHQTDTIAQSLEEKKETTLAAFAEHDIEGFNARTAALREKVGIVNAEVSNLRLAPRLVSQPPHQAEQKTFWQRHKQIIIGAMIGLAVIAAVAIIIGSIVASGGASAAAIAAFGGAVVATCGVAGTVALCVTAGAAICAVGAGIGFAGKKIEERQRAPKRSLQAQSSTANAFDALGVNSANLTPASPPIKRARGTTSTPVTPNNAATLENQLSETLLHHPRTP